MAFASPPLSQGVTSQDRYTSCVNTLRKGKPCRKSGDGAVSRAVLELHAGLGRNSMSADLQILKTTCPLDCPDTCSILVRVEGGRVTRLEGDPQHPFTRGFLCH